jgi:uncharacterized protein (DUF934 family)
MTLIKNGEVAENTWRNLEDDDQVSGEEAIIVSLARWQTEKDTFAGRNGALGIRLESHQKPEAIADDVDRFDLIALDFSALPDGRAFSYARILRERYGYKGELRAVGKVIQDQLFFMHRCGFDAFELSEGEDIDKSIAALSSFTVAYQPSADDIQPAYKTRHSV